MKLRFAPSPTGYLHLGNARTLIINYLLAQKLGAQFLLRFDDTDQSRCKPEYGDQIIQDLEWLGIQYATVVYQLERLAIYDAAIDRLKHSGHLYPCFETKDELDFKRKRQLSQGRPPLYDRSALNLTPDQITKLVDQGKQPHWRFKMSPTAITWTDLSHGQLTFDGQHLSDPVVIRGDGTPLFTLVGIIDDIDMNITHIVRGDDHITNTAVQLQIAQALGAHPQYLTFAHIPLITDNSGAGLSKRLGSLSLRDLKQQGFEPAAVINYLAAMGTGAKPLSSININDIVQQTELSQLGKSSPKFSLQDLQSVNCDVMHHLPFAAVQSAYPQLTESLWHDVRGNLNFRQDVEAILTICFGVIQPIVEDSDRDLLSQAASCLPPEPWTIDTWGQWTAALSDRTGLRGKALFLPLRLALTAQDHGPEMKKILPHMGYDRVMARLQGSAG